MQNESASLLKDSSSFHNHLSERLMQTSVQELQSAHPTRRPTNRADWIPDGSIRRHEDQDQDKSKIQSRISDCDQSSPVESCSMGPSSSQDQIHANISMKTRNVEAGLSEQRTSTNAAGPDAREELRRFLASSIDREPIIEERLRSLERDYMKMLLEVWRLKLEFARVKRELRSELFRVKMERIMD
jgi:hypothetical protein